MGHDVFVSYASGDKTVADAVVATLEGNGVRCWIAPRDVMPGVHYGEAIIDAIHECRIMVLVFSSKANLSGHIPKEIERAVSGGVTVMPLRIEEVAPAKSLDYFIGSVHWLDALTPPLEIHLKKLAANVQTLLARKVPGTDTPAVPVFSPPRIPPPSTGTPTASRAARPPWTNAVIGGLVAIIAILGFLAYRFKAQEQPSPPQAAVNLPPQPTVPTAAPEAPKTVAVTKSISTAAAPAAPVPAAAPTPKKEIVPVASPPKTQISLHYEPESTVKLEQLIGEEDKERHQQTRNQTFSRYGLQGSDLGYSFEHQGHAYFLFGTTVGHFARALGTVALTDASDPDSGVKLDFLTSGSRYLGVESSDQHRVSRRVLAGDVEVPVTGISLGGQMYVVITSNHSADRTQDISVLTKFVPPTIFQPLRTISALPAGHFIQGSLHTEPGPIAGLPSGGPFVFFWGTGSYKKSDAYLSIVPEADFETGKGTRYFAGLDASKNPTWSDNETDAKPIVENGTLGDLSVTWCKDLGLWLMTYDSREDTRGIEFSYSRTPWGPWSDPQVVFNMVRDKALGKYIHNSMVKTDDGLAGPVLGQKNQTEPGSVHGGSYAPYVVERWTKVQGSELNLYYVLSTLNPYVVVLMKSRLKVD